MLSRRLPLLVTLAYTSTTLYETPAYGQLPESPPPDLQNEVLALKAENATIRDQLRRLEEQQKRLLQLLESSQVPTVVLDRIWVI